MKTVLVPLGLGLFCFGLMMGCGPKPQRSTVGDLLADEGEDVDLVEELTGIDENTPVAAVEDEEERPTNAVHEPGPAQDEDFIGGEDRISYFIPVDSTTGPVTVTARLLYAPLSYSFIKDLQKDDLPRVNQFIRYWQTTDKVPAEIGSSTKTLH